MYRQCRYTSLYADTWLIVALGIPSSELAEFLHHLHNLHNLHKSSQLHKLMVPSRCSDKTDLLDQDQPSCYQPTYVFIDASVGPAPPALSLFLLSVLLFCLIPLFCLYFPFLYGRSHSPNDAFTRCNRQPAAFVVHPCSCSCRVILLHRPIRPYQSSRTTRSV